MTERSDVRVKGLRLWARFSLSMTIALTIVMSVAGAMLYNSAASVAENVQEQTLQGAVELLSKADDITWKQDGNQLDSFRNGTIQRSRIMYGRDEENLNNQGFLYRYKVGDNPHFDLIVPGQVERAQRGLLGLIIALVTIVVLVGAGVAMAVANQVSTPLDNIVSDIGQIAAGNLHHRTRVRVGGEIALLARSVDRMAKNLQQAQETELELSVREREVEVASEVTEALLPHTTPSLAGYSIGAEHIGSSKLGGDFHDFIELGDGRVGILVCDVSGAGLPGALVGARAGAYLRYVLSRGGDVAEALKSVNHELLGQLRRGTYVSAVYMLVDPIEGVATVACAGHKIPLIRFTAADGKIRLVHPEGISLGFDKGPIFDSRLEILQTPIEPGDRLVLANTGPVVLANRDGKELGEKAFYGQVMKYSNLPTDEFLAKLRSVLEKYAGGTALPRDISIVTISRD